MVGDREAQLRAERAKFARSMRDNPYDSMSFGAAFNAAKAEGRSDFPWRGDTYSTETREERTQKAYSDTSRKQEGAAAKVAQQTGRNRPDETAVRPSVGLKDVPGLIARGMSEGVERVPAGRGLGAAFTAAGAARAAGAEAVGALARREAARKTAEAERLASRIDPMLAVGRTRETGKFRRNEAPLSEARRQAREEMAAEPQYRKGGAVKTYAKGGSVKGAGCEQRGVRKCKVY